ncbi:GNAT family N-acetyltransferase [Bacillus sp. USDA818B3_A]|uniref:GNAT family N-acetyltransferase n=1 Tax=Bacillus sp. USDA818B3_A TaxID=2698834 RepID=UPI001F471BCC|nr:GNAT family N-acetyltransferase [Bacillus sp. USDA818B3_A]
MGKRIGKKACFSKPHRTGPFVKEEYRNRGIGGIIVDFLIDYAKQLGYEEITLGVDTDNLNARHLYKKKGFTIVLYFGEDEYGEYVKLLKKLK